MIYLYVQVWMCHPKVEKGLHWNGMILKFACWPVFFLGFVLSLVNKEIPYIPTAKQAVIGKISPFARPLVAHILLFAITVVYIVYQRRFLVPETILVKTAEQTWGMIAFATVSVLLAVGGIYAVIESKKLKAEDPWEKIDVSNL